MIKNNLKELCTVILMPYKTRLKKCSKLKLMRCCMDLCIQEKLGPVVMFSDSLNAVQTIAKMMKGEDEIQPSFKEFVDLMRERSFLIFIICIEFK